MVTFSCPILDDFPGWSTDFDLLYRQEVSSTAGGTTIVKDMGTPLWQAAFTTIALRPNELDMWRAKLKVLEGGLHEFWSAPSSRCYPIAYLRLTNGTVAEGLWSDAGNVRPQQATIPAPAGVSLAPTAVVDFIYNRTSDPEWTVPARRPPNSGGALFNASYSIQPNSITIYNEAEQSIKLRYVVFNADTRPQTSDGNEMFREGNGFIQIKKPGSSDINPIPSDILVGTRYPSMQIIKQGYLPRSAFTDVGRDTNEHRRFGRYKAVVDFQNDGFMPYIKYTRVFESSFGPPMLELGIYNVGTYFRHNSRADLVHYAF